MKTPGLARFKDNSSAHALRLEETPSKQQNALIGLDFNGSQVTNSRQTICVAIEGNQPPLALE